MLGNLVKVASAAGRLKAAGNDGFSAKLALLQELSESLGLEIDFQFLGPQERATAFQNTARAAVQPGSGALAVKAKDKDGNEFQGIFIVSTKQPVVEGGTVVRISGGQVLSHPAKPQG